MKHMFQGKRIERGLYRVSNGRFINADINGASNILRKVAPDAFQQAEGVEDGARVFTTLVVHPVRIVVPVRTQKARVRQRKQAIKRTQEFATKRQAFWNYPITR